MSVCLSVSFFCSVAVCFAAAPSVVLAARHSGECATNKEQQEAFLARKKKLAEKNKETPTKPTKSTRRGNNGGLREIERQILKENKMT